MTLYVPTQGADDWKQFLADPEKQWKQGYSARTLAHSWQEANGFPVEVRAALAENFPNIELLLGLPEHKVPLPGGGRATQTDVWALARSGDELVSIAVEGKVSESFGPTLEEWLIDASPGKRERLAYLCGELGCSLELPRAIRYQLLHRTVAAIIEAKRFGAKHAVMLVHSFSKIREWFEDYEKFAAVLGAQVAADRVVRVGERGGVQLWLAWVCGDERYLKK